MCSAMPRSVRLELATFLVCPYFLQKYTCIDLSSQRQVHSRARGAAVLSRADPLCHFLCFSRQATFCISPRQDTYIDVQETQARVEGVAQIIAEGVGVQLRGGLIGDRDTQGSVLHIGDWKSECECCLEAAGGQVSAIARGFMGDRGTQESVVRVLTGIPSVSAAGMLLEGRRVQFCGGLRSDGETRGSVVHVGDCELECQRCLNDVGG